VPNDDYSRSQIRNVGKSISPFKRKMKKTIMNDVERAEGELFTPFDEVYHKERKLV